MTKNLKHRFPRRENSRRPARAFLFALAILALSGMLAGTGFPQRLVSQAETAAAEIETTAAAETETTEAAEAAAGSEGLTAASADAGTETTAVDAALGYRDSPVAMEASYGYDNMAKGGRYLPVYISLTSRQDGEFTGSLKIRSMESDYQLYEYEYPVKLAGQETTQMNLNIPLGVRADQLYVLLFDAGGNEIVKKRLKMNMRQDTPELLIGTLSDTQSQLEYLNGVGISHSTLSTRTCTMVAGSIPEQAAGMDQLDVLLITNYDIRRLQVSQIDTIKEWVSRGGILILGTGNSGQEAVETFLEDELENELPDPEASTVNMGEEFSIYSLDDVRIPLDCTWVQMKDGNEVLSSDGRPVLTAVNREKGMIAVAAYDFSDIGSFCEEHSYVDKLFTSLLGSERIQGLADYLYNGGNTSYWSVQSMINTGSVEKLPHISLFVTVIVSYILLAGPGLYFFLKQREMRGFYRPFIILLSICCSGMIYLLGSRTRFDNTFFNYATVRDYSEDTILETTYMNMRTPYNKPYAVTLGSDYDIRPITASKGSEDSRFSKFTGEEDYNIGIRYEQDGTRLSVQDVAAFSPNYFRLEKREENPEGSGISGSISFFEDQLTGTITNDLSVPLEHAAVLVSGTMVCIDRLEPGESVDLSTLELLYYPVNNNLMTADRITGGYRFDEANIDSKEYMTALERTNLLSFYMENFLTGYQSKARIVGFAAGDRAPGFLNETGYEIDGLTMFTTSLDVNYEQAGKRYHTSLERIPHVVSGNYNTLANTMDGSAPVTLEYALGKEFEVETLTMLPISDSFTESSRYGSIPVFTGDIYFYNCETGNYDKMEQGQTTFSDWQLEPYLSADHVLNVRYVFSSGDDNKYDISLPMITAVGKE